MDDDCGEGEEQSVEPRWMLPELSFFSLEEVLKDELHVWQVWTFWLHRRHASAVGAASLA